MKHLMVLLVAFVYGAADGAVYRCVGEDGKPVFQAVQCNGQGEIIEVKPASGPADDIAEPTSITGQLRKMESERSKMERQHRAKIVREEIKDQQRALAAQEAATNAELARLRLRKSYANNNLAGATLEQAISTEMQVVSEAGRAKAERIQRSIDAKRRYSESLMR